MYIACTIEKIDHSGYTMQREVANRAVTTETPCAPVGMVLIWGTVYALYLAARSLSHKQSSLPGRPHEVGRYTQLSAQVRTLLLYSDV